MWTIALVLRVKVVPKSTPREVLSFLIPPPHLILLSFSPCLSPVLLVSGVSFLLWRREVLKLGHRRDSAFNSHVEESGAREGRSNPRDREEGKEGGETQDQSGRGQRRTPCLGASLIPTCGTKASKHGPRMFQNTREAAWGAHQCLEVPACLPVRRRPSTCAIPLRLRHPPGKEAVLPAPCGGCPRNVGPRQDL